MKYPWIPVKFRKHNQTRRSHIKSCNDKKNIFEIVNFFYYEIYYSHLAINPTTLNYLKLRKKHFKFITRVYLYIYVHLYYYKPVPAAVKDSIAILQDSSVLKISTQDWRDFAVVFPLIRTNFIF